MKKLLIIYRLFDRTYGPQGNSKTLAVRLNEDSTLGYAFYGGWQSSGTPFSLSNLQMQKSLPMGTRGKKVEDIDREVRECLATGCGSRHIHSSEILNDL